MSVSPSPQRARKPPSLGEQDLNSLENMTMPISRRDLSNIKRKRSAVSMSGTEDIIKGVAGTMSPRRKARRSLQPRKSILKPSGGDDTIDFAQQAHTIAFFSSQSRPSLGRRRVSFAPNAHVRMFEPNPVQLSTTVPESGSPLPTGQRPSHSSHSRRSSITSLSQLQQVITVPPPQAQVYFQGEGEEQGEASMELDTESERSDSSDDPLDNLSPERFDEGHGGNIFSFGSVPPVNVDEGNDEDDEAEDEDDMEMEMEETVSYGGIIRRQSAIVANTSGASEDDSQDMSIISIDEEKTMDFTIAVGGIMPATPPAGALKSRASIGYNIPAIHGEMLEPPILPGDGDEDEIDMEVSMKSIGAPVTYLQSPAEGVVPFGFPSNITLPPASSDASFDSDEDSEGEGEDQEKDDWESQTIALNTFLEMKEPRKSMGSPVRYLQSPAEGVVVRSSFGFPSNLPPPTPSPAARFNGEEASDGEEEDQEKDAWEPQTIALGTFLEMVGVQFMDALPLLNRRRSSVARGVLGQSPAEREFSLHEFTEAQVQAVFLNMYSWASNKMKDDIRQGQMELASTESICDEENPMVVREYLSANEDDRQLFEITLREFKTNTQLRARQKWYEWKLSLMESIKPDVEKTLMGMKEDQKRLETLSVQANLLLPDLRARHAALQEELIREREVAAEIAVCDQAELADLKAAVVEQNVEISRFKSELDESQIKLTELEGKMTELGVQHAEHTTAIDTARALCDQFTPSDVLRLGHEYETLQSLHLWRMVRITPNVLEMIYDHEIILGVSRSAIDGTMDVSTAHASLKRKLGPQMVSPTEGLFALVQHSLIGIKRSKPTLSELVRHVGRVWTAAQRIRQELRILSFRHPVTYCVSAGANTQLECRASFVVPKQNAKAALTFLINVNSLVAWPEAMSAIGVKTNLIYGTVDTEAITRAATDTVQSAIPHVPGLLVQACVEAAAACA